jgi:hypothetical protein
MKKVFVKTNLRVEKPSGESGTASASASANITEANRKKTVNKLVVQTTSLAQTIALNSLTLSVNPTSDASKASSSDYDADQNTTATSGTSSVAWNGGIINGYFYWQGNFVGSSGTTQHYANSVSAAQPANGSSSNIVQGSSTYTYKDGVPTGQGINAVWLFSGYSNATSALNSTINYTTGSNTYNNAFNYLKGTGQPYLLGITFGGGASATGSWNTGSSGAIYSIYAAVTQKGLTFSYTETGTGNKLTGTGLGTLTNQYNSIMLDIETWSGPSGSTGQDFLNLCSYIKYDSKSMFQLNGVSYECIIPITISHSCSNYNGTGLAVISAILQDQNGYYDYIVPQMYTQNIGTTNEYVSNSNITWPSFINYLKNNYFYNQKYGLGFILPTINFNSLLNAGGTNNNLPPNLYWYQSSDTNSNPATFGYQSGTAVDSFSTDTGVENFFNAVSGVTATLGGSVQWVNGTLGSTSS